MKNTQNDKNSGYSWTTEDRLSQIKKRKKKGKINAVLWMLGYLVVLVLVMYGAASLFVWLDDGIKKNTEAAADALGVREELEGKTGQDVRTGTEEQNKTDVTYTQAQLDEMIAKAVEEAKTQATAEEAERILGGIETGLTEGETMVETLRPFYPGDIVVVSNGSFHFVPIQEDLKKHSRVDENLIQLETGELQYQENGQVISHKGIDVSKHQGKIDWQQVAGDGVEFAFIRVGLRGYGTGKVVLDEMFEENIKGATEAGIKVGVYFYSQAINEEEAREEAALVLEQIAPYDITMPVVYDVEKVSGDSARMNALTVEERTKVTLAFCQAIEEAGYQPMIYHNMEVGTLMLDLTALEQYDKWFAYYNPDIYYPYEHQIWQYTDKGTVAGIDGEVDMNISFQMWDSSQ